MLMISSSIVTPIRWQCRLIRDSSALQGWLLDGSAGGANISLYGDAVGEAPACRIANGQHEGRVNQSLMRSAPLAIDETIDV